MRKLYCHDTPSDGNPHAVVIEVSDEDSARFEGARDSERDVGIGMNAPGGWLLMTDLNTGDAYRVRTYPCGAGCRCAAQAVRLSGPTPLDAA